MSNPNPSAPEASKKSPEVLALEQELAEERRRIEELDAAAEADELRSKLDAAKQERLTKELIRKFEGEYGKYGRAFSMVQSSTGPVFFARKEQVIFRRFQNVKKVTDEAIEQYIKPCVIYPSREEFDQILDREMGLGVTIADRLSYLYGFRKADIEGKA